MQENYRIRPVRLVFVIAWLVGGFVYKGAVGLWEFTMLLGIPLFIFYAAESLLHKIWAAFTQPREMFVTVRDERQHPDIEGKSTVFKHPDPTRPSDDDFKVLTWNKSREG